MQFKIRHYILKICYWVCYFIYDKLWDEPRSMEDETKWLVWLLTRTVINPRNEREIKMINIWRNLRFTIIATNLVYDSKQEFDLLPKKIKSINNIWTITLRNDLAEAVFIVFSSSPLWSTFSWISLVLLYTIHLTLNKIRDDEGIRNHFHH